MINSFWQPCKVQASARFHQETWASHKKRKKTKFYFFFVYKISILGIRSEYWDVKAILDVKCLEVHF